MPPKPTTKTENARKQYTAQDSFRFTTPDAKVVARTVDPMVRQRLNRVEDPATKMLGQVRPQRPMQLSRLVGPPQPNAPFKPISMLDPVPELVDPTLKIVGNIVNWLGTEGIQAAKQSAKKDAAQAYIEANERILAGEDAQKVLSESRPETFLGFAEEAYDSMAGTAIGGEIGDALQKIVEANPMIRPEELEKHASKLQKEFGVGQSVFYKTTMINETMRHLNTLKSSQKAFIREREIEDHLMNIKQAFPNLYQQALEANPDLKPNSPEFHEGLRNYITSVQNKGLALGVSKDKTTKAVIDALGSWMVANTDKVTSPHEMFGWTAIKDHDGIAVESKYYDVIDGWEDRFQAEIEQQQRSANFQIAQEAKEFEDGILNSILEDQKAGRSIDAEAYKQRVLDGAHSFKQKEALYAAIDAASGVAWEDNQQVVDELMAPFLDGRTREIPTLEELNDRFAQREISAQTRDKIRKLRTAVANTYVNAAMTELRTVYKSSSGELLADPTFTTERFKLATDYFNDLLTEEIDRTGGVPNPEAVDKIKQQVYTYVDRLTSKGAMLTFDSPSDFLKANLFPDNPAMEEDAFLQKFPGSTPATYVKAVEQYAKAVEQAAAMKRLKENTTPKPEAAPVAAPAPTPEATTSDPWASMRKLYPNAPAPAESSGSSNAITDFLKERWNDVNFREAFQRDFGKIGDWIREHNEEALKSYNKG